MAKRKVRREAKGKGGRPPKEIDIRRVNDLCEVQCTGEEIAAVLEIDYDTLNAALKRQTGMGFSDYYALKKGKGRASLRRKQWQLAMNGNPTMLIFLGKQNLDQYDKPPPPPPVHDAPNLTPAADDAPHVIDLTLVDDEKPADTEPATEH